MSALIDKEVENFHKLLTKGRGNLETAVTSFELIFNGILQWQLR